VFSAQNKRKTLFWKPSQIFLWLESVFRWSIFLMINKHRKVWKMVSRKLFFAKQTEPKSFLNFYTFFLTSYFSVFLSFYSLIFLLNLEHGLILLKDIWVLYSLVQRNWIISVFKLMWCYWNPRKYIAYILITQVRNNKVLRTKNSSLTITKLRFFILKCFNK